MKKVLIISYYWPPAGGPGVQRWLKFAKYLPQFGFEPIILTVHPDEATYPVRDESLLGETSKMEVHHTSTSELFGTYQKASGRKEVPYSGFANESDKPGPRQKLAKFVRGNFFIPDPRKGWNKHAIPKALELIDKYQITNVVTTSPPHSTQLIGLKLKQQRAINWLADLRDPWTDIYYYHQFYPTKVAQKIDAGLERKVLEQADNVACVSADIKRLFAEKSKDINPEKIVVLPNGFDAQDFEAEVAEVPESDFLICYTGTITSDYKVETFLEVLKRLQKTTERKIRLQFIGKRDEQTEKLLKEYDGDFKIELLGLVSHKEAVQVMKSCHALLLAIPKIKNNEGILTGKIFEYLAAQKPIIGIGPSHGDAAQILTETAAGAMLDYDSKDEMYSFIEQLIQKKWSHQSSSIQYSRENLTGTLTKLFS